MTSKSNRNNYFLIILCFFIIISSILIIDNPSLFDFSSSATPTPTTANSDAITTNVVPNSIISNPLKLSGQIDSSWQSECAFMIEIVDYDNSISYSYPVRVDDGQDCNSATKLNFSTDIKFQVAGQKGAIVILSDNPSGLPENQKKFTIPVSFN